MDETQCQCITLVNDQYHTSDYIKSYLNKKNSQQQIPVHSLQQITVQEATAKMFLTKSKSNKPKHSEDIEIKQNQQLEGIVIIDEYSLIGLSTLKKINKV